ncbi:ABC transporter substrate-binding protein [Pseudobutyrivibrio ruminis]|jgi:raffinose/stachyose/melibiose transport system substrate-binding protein|uniref:Carbohydrate ABC transporter substrate-binding protein, CUT1 family (TC 3.A.1.1.-) n=1 Tax=Pseudobutyrivibrio ruminis DSM 9787 TaxID=1123011 RepID=A0A285SIX9_9FIRM|nr:ABC transporter substrate-binding protein [Pseudobutyrivibrio ruminis]SOC06075.1 carbohydrate ABC transporter substrate-binding protein, CUT1 family (TC 3.A.1.1.-) [Pseudobutyrivibrio ruminis DSM 9787]
MKKRLLSLMVVAAMSASLVACGSSEGGSSDGASGSGVSITVLNSKTEIQTQFEEMAEAYEEATGVHVEVYNADTDTTVASQVATKYASNDPYTLTMVDAKDIYSLADDYAYDLSNEDWASHTTLGITVNDKLAGFPVCVEARGVIYNADAIEAITGETFDPSSVATLDDFQALLDELKAGGMETPVGVLSEYWSLGAHYFAEVYEQQEDPDAFVNSLLAGEADLGSNEKFNELMDTFDTLIAYNYAKGSAANADREESSMMLAQGDIAFMFGGNWDWSVINQYDYTENMGIMPVPENTSDDTNTKLVGGGSKYFFVDSSDATSDEQRQAALDFLNWLVSDPEGNAFLTEQCALVPAFDNIDASALDPLSLSVKSYADAGKLIPNYNYLPDDHMTVVGQEIMQKYLDEAMTRDELVTAVEEYFKTATPIEH